MENDAHPDWQLILSLGGPLKVAALLGYSKPGSVQRVQNWKRRGIPAEVKVERPDLFLRERMAALPMHAPASPAAAGAR